VNPQSAESQEQSRESANFDRLVTQHKDAVYRQMVRVCGNHADAEDVLIEAMLKAYRHLDQLQNSSAFRAWLAQIGRRVCWQLRQREALLPILQLSELEEAGTEIKSLAPAAALSFGPTQSVWDLTCRNEIAVIPGSRADSARAGRSTLKCELKKRRIGRAVYDRVQGNRAKALKERK